MFKMLYWFLPYLILFPSILGILGDINLTLGMLNKEGNISKVRKTEKNLFPIHFF